MIMLRFAVLPVFLLITVMAPAQEILLKDSAFVNLVNLPGKTKNPVTTPYVYLLSDHDVYDLFGYDTGTAYRHFDFEQYHILGMYACRQCTMNCVHEPGDKNAACHRNRCVNGWIWLKRKNSIAFSSIPSVSLRTTDRDYPYRDTVIQTVSPADSAVWKVNVGGDCHARHVIKLYRDNAYPLVVMKEHNYYGGCRAGGFWQMTVRFMPPAGNWQYLHNTILEKRYDNDSE